MIFVTVGTHEQQFNRLVEYMDKWAAEHEEEVIIQTGFCTYEPKHCEHQKLYPYEKMKELTAQARIVISHGGPSSFILALKCGRIPVVVPRMLQYREHINDHQLDFCREMVKRWDNLLVVEDMNILGDVIERYDEITKDMVNSFTGNNENFCAQFEKIVENL